MDIPDVCPAVRVHAHGDPAAVVHLEQVAVRRPGPGELLIRMRRAAINPADINVIEGSYGRLPTLPATLGNEGLGEVVARGAGVTGLEVGALVRPRDGIGTWAAWCTAPADRCIALPAGLPIDQAAQLTVNPGTAWAVLHEFGPCQAGDWVLLNAPTSAVGRSLIVLAARRGLRVLALVRRTEEVPTVRALGAAAVVVEERAAAAEIRRLTGGAARLALNQVGGDSAVILAKALAPLGTLVTIGALARQPLTLPNGAVIFGELRSCGFWVSRWFERADPALVGTMVTEVADLMRTGALHLPVAGTHRLEDIATALAHARTSGRGGKVMLGMGEA